MLYVIKRIDQGGGYLAPPGSQGSYTHNLAAAATFPNKEAAERERCPGNEIVLELDRLLPKYR